MAEMVQSNVKVSKLTNFDFTIIEVYHAQAKQKIKFRSAVSILYVSRANLHRFSSTNEKTETEERAQETSIRHSSGSGA